MPPFFAIPNLAINAAGSSQLGGVFESSSESELDASRTDNCDSSSSTDSSVSSVSLSDGEEDEINGIPYSSDDTVRGRVPPNTPKNVSTIPFSSQRRNSDGEAGDQTGEVTPSASSSLVRERRISRLSDELHTVLAPHTLGTLARRKSMPDGNSYHYVHNELDYHMHYHQDNHSQHHLLKEHRQQRLPPPPQHHTFTHHEHNLCPTEYDRVDRWRIFAGTFIPSPVRSPDCGTPIHTPPRAYDDHDEPDETEGPEPMSPTLLLQKLRALSNDLNRVADPNTSTASVRRTAERGRGRNGRNGNVRVEVAGANRAFDKRRKEILTELAELAELAERAAQEISSTSPSSPKGHSRSGTRKQGRGGGGGASTRLSSSRPYEDSNWVVMDGETEMISGMRFHESSMSEVDCQWDAPKPKFLQKLFQ